MLTIRTLQRRDLAEVVKIERQSFSDPWPRKEFMRLMKERATGLQVIQMGDVIGGYVVYDVHRRQFAILSIAVNPAFRREGLATALVAKIKSKLSQRRRCIWTNVSENNVPAQKFFRAVDFQASGIIKNPWGCGTSAIRFCYCDPKRFTSRAVRNRIAKYFQGSKS